jgi:heparanase 1
VTSSKLQTIAAALSLGLALTAAAQSDPAHMPAIAHIDPRFQSYNVEMVEIIGGRFWKPYASVSPKPQTGSGTLGGIDPNLFEQRTPIDLTNPELSKLASALGPAYIRVSGSWANNVFFQDSDAPAPAQPPTGFGGTLTRPEWKRVLDFSRAVNAKLVTSFAVSTGVRDANGVWTPTQAQAFVTATHQLGGSIAAAEFFNEPNLAVIADVPKGYDGKAYARDYAVFHDFLRKASPQTTILGPSGTGEGLPIASMKLIPSEDMLKAMGPNSVDVFSYHFYGTVSQRCAANRIGAGTTPEAALTEDWLSRTSTVEAFYAHLRDQYEPGKPMWLTEVGQTACGGDRWASTFLDTFRYLDQLGRLAQANVQVVMHNTLAASDYGLLDERTLTPRPNYWAALLWHRTMGTTVLNPGPAPSPTVHLYAQCTVNQPGSVTLLAINLSRTDPAHLHLDQPAQRYTLTAPELESHEALLNNHPLTLTATGDLPSLTAIPEPSGSATLPPASLTFFVIPAARNRVCK